MLQRMSHSASIPDTDCPISMYLKCALQNRKHGTGVDVTSERSGRLGQVTWDRYIAAEYIT